MLFNCMSMAACGWEFSDLLGRIPGAGRGATNEIPIVSTVAKNNERGSIQSAVNVLKIHRKLNMKRAHRLQMALLFSSVPCDNITATIGQAFSQVKRRKWRPDVTILGRFLGIFGMFSQVCYPSLPNNGK